MTIFKVFRGILAEMIGIRSALERLEVEVGNTRILMKARLDMEKPVIQAKKREIELERERLDEIRERAGEAPTEHDLIY